MIPDAFVRQPQAAVPVAAGMSIQSVPLFAVLVLAVHVCAAENSYEFYQPQVTHVTIHEGKLAEGHFAYNHMPSVEWFDGRYHAVWGAHAETVLEGKPGQVNVWTTSTDFTQWSAPQHLAHTGPGALARDPLCVQWQPNLLNFHDRQLWCVWSFNSKVPELDGLYLSTLDKGSGDWHHRRIQRRQDVNGMSCSIFASQNPVLLSSGRVLAPVTLNYREPKRDAGAGQPASGTVRRFNACFYTDDGGATWACSNPISTVEDAEAQWEPFFYEQSDGNLRVFMRNFTKGIPLGTQWRLTTVGSGAALGTPVSFPNDPIYSFMETVNCRPQIFRLDGGRYCLLQQDALVNHRDYSTRLNVALHFSRSGNDDFVAGPPVSRPGTISAYPQGVAHGGNIYLAYTMGPGTQPRSIEGAIVTPAPLAGRYYVWPRSKEILKMQDIADETGKKNVVRTNPDARTALPRIKTVDERKAIQFNARASAGVDIDPVDFAAGQTLEFQFETHVLRLQPVGTLIFCSLGDRIPIRLGMPANRPGKLYAYTRNQWEPVGDFALQQWHTLRVTVRGTDFTVSCDGHVSKTFPNPLVNPQPRLYLGDSFEVDYIYSLSGSEFLVDLASLHSHVAPELNKN
ncbi:MAG: sialidase family protein [Planctomycetota bacterium]